METSFRHVCSASDSVKSSMYTLLTTIVTAKPEFYALVIRDFNIKLLTYLGI